MSVYELPLATLGPVHARDAQAHWRQVGRVADSGTETLEFNHTGQVCALVVAMRSNPSSSPSGYRSPIMRLSRSAEPPPVGARNRRLCSGLDQAVVDGVRSRPQSARRPGDVAVGRGGVGGGGPRGRGAGSARCSSHRPAPGVDRRGRVRGPGGVVKACPGRSQRRWLLPAVDQRGRRRSAARVRRCRAASSGRSRNRRRGLPRPASIAVCRRCPAEMVDVVGRHADEDARSRRCPPSRRRVGDARGAPRLL